MSSMKKENDQKSQFPLDRAKTKVQRKVKPTQWKKEKDLTKRKEIRRQHQKRKRRLIVRNLSFKVTEDELNNIFSKYGNVVDVSIPLMENKKKRGFGFVQFEHFHSLITAMKELNYKEIYGRPVAIDYAMGKTQYQEKMPASKTKITDNCETLSEQDIKKESDCDESESEVSELEIKSNEEISDSEKRVQTFFKEFDSESKTNNCFKQESSNIGSSDSESDDDACNDDEDDDESDQHSKLKKNSKYYDKPISSTANRKQSNDIAEGKTVFIRNVSFVTTEEGLQETMEEYGEFEYCLLCMDQLTDHPKGTAFVKFKSKEDAEKLIQKSADEQGIFLDGRQLQCSYAISRDAIQKQYAEKAKQPKDNRNLHLMKAGLIMPNSEEAKGVSQADMTKRAQLELSKKQKLKNLNYFISDKRLIIYNIPPHFTDTELQRLFKQAAGPKAILTEAKIMRDLKKIDALGKPASRGYGFVGFKWPDNALRALEKLNNNPNVFTSQNRPIVEFSIENKMALLAKERRENAHLRNKRRLEERTEQLNEQAKIESQQDSSKGIVISNKRKRGKVNSSSTNAKKDRKKTKFNNPIAKPKHSTPDMSEDKKTKKRNKKKGKGMAKQQNEECLSDLIRKYKGKLLNKMS